MLLTASDQRVIVLTGFDSRVRQKHAREAVLLRRRKGPRNRACTKVQVFNREQELRYRVADEKVEGMGSFDCRVQQR